MRYSSTRRSQQRNVVLVIVLLAVGIYALWASGRASRRNDEIEEAPLGMIPMGLAAMEPESFLIVPPDELHCRHMLTIEPMLPDDLRGGNTAALTGFEGRLTIADETGAPVLDRSFARADFRPLRVPGADERVLALTFEPLPPGQYGLRISVDRPPSGPVIPHHLFVRRHLGVAARWPVLLYTVVAAVGILGASFIVWRSFLRERLTGLFVEDPYG